MPMIHKAFYETSYTNQFRVCLRKPSVRRAMYPDHLALPLYPNKSRDKVVGAINWDWAIRWCWWGDSEGAVLGEWWRIVDGIDQSKASPLGFVRRRRSLQNLVQHNQRMTQTGENSHKPTSILHQRCVRWGIFLRIT